VRSLTASAPLQAAKAKAPSAAAGTPEAAAKPGKRTQVKAVPGANLPRAPKPYISEEAKAFMLSTRKRTSTPVIFKIRTRRQTPIVFTLDEVRDILQKRKHTAEDYASIKAALPTAKVELEGKSKPKAVATTKVKAEKNRVLGAASLSDVLGYNPSTAKPTTPADEEAAKIPSKFKSYYALLVKLRSQIKSRIDQHAQDSLRRSNKEDSGELSSYGQHMADAGTDTFDQEFALSLLSSEQEALMEIDEAIQRMIIGTYGVCEVTGKPINKERLMAVPFTRCSVEGQEQLERQRRRTLRSGQTAALFNEILEDEGARTFGDEDGR
jgi:RNA polymerase-binding transcription factor DksA